MANILSFFLVIYLLNFSPILCLSSKANNYGYLYPQFYDRSCPKAKEIVKSVVAKAVATEGGMAASLLRLHFHDCFVKAGGPTWEVPLGRRDSRDASLSDSNNNIPAPNNTFNTILTKFLSQGLDLVDLITLLGAHTIGNARCTSFRQRLYNQYGNNLPDYTLDQSYAAQLRTRCPRSGSDGNLFFLDYVSPTKFDNSYFKNLLASRGLLNSDQVLATMNPMSLALVNVYANNNEIFFEQFARSIVKMGNISPLTADRGEIRKNCRKINS
ncbi:peroxidase 72-like isoform X2 [Lycium barbarum]|uniref:peroxidase 72-like isoform X2 n=1 Tax=Lycium barbarum TaxID=112863 RepID=UPI00293E30A5|nr:peroxidase 72-like isoform X2 [Lycium barbarum]